MGDGMSAATIPPPTEQPTWAVWINPVAAALYAAALYDGQPTGVPWADVAQRAVFAAVVVHSAGSARREAGLFLAAGAVLVASSIAMQLLAFAGLIIAVRRFLPLQFTALLALPALLSQGADPLARLTGGAITDPFGSSAALTALLVAPTLLSLRRRSSRRANPAVVRCLAVLGVTTVAMWTITAWAAVEPTRRAVAESRSAAQAIEAGQMEAAAHALGRAGESWRIAEERLTEPWMRPIDLVPVASQHIRLGRTGAGEASKLTAAAEAATLAMAGTPLDADESSELATVVRLEAPLAGLATSGRDAIDRLDAAQSPWLARPISERVESGLVEAGPLVDQLAAASSLLAHLSDVLHAPDGASVIVGFTTPSEARGAGGFVGQWAEFRADSGQLELLGQYRSKAVNDRLAQVAAAAPFSEDALRRYDRYEIERHVQDVTLSPDGPTVSRAVAALWEQAFGRPVSAVVLLDPFAIETLLSFTGPVRFNDVVLDNANAAEVLLTEQYVLFDNRDDERAELLRLVAARTTERLLEEPPSPQALLEALRPLADQRRLTIWFASDPHGVDTGAAKVGGRFIRGSEDLVAVVHQNAGQNKIDPFLDRTVSIETTVSPSTNRVRHRVSVELHNRAPADGLPDAIIGSNDQGLPAGTNRLTLSVYSSALVASATVEGRVVGVESQREFGVGVHSVNLMIGPGETRTATFSFETRADLSDGFDIEMPMQPLARPDHVEWVVQTDSGTIRGPDGWWSDGATTRWSGRLDAPRQQSFELR